MKKLYTLILAGLGAMSVNAQSSLEIRDLDGNLMSGQTMTIPYLSTDSEAKTDTVNVINTSGANVSVRCKRYEIAVVPAAKNALCWTVCSMYYTTGTYPVLNAPSTPQTIAPGDSRDLFVLHYEPHGTSGNSLFRIVFYNVSNPNDSTSMDVLFTSPTGLNEASKSAASINAYPNPASNNITIDIENFSEAGTVTITNALGRTVKTIQVNENQNSLSVGTTELSEGVYFYSLRTHNKAILTRRFVISR